MLPSVSSDVNRKLPNEDEDKTKILPFRDVQIRPELQIFGGSGGCSRPQQLGKALNLDLPLASPVSSGPAAYVCCAAALRSGEKDVSTAHGVHWRG